MKLFIYSSLIELILFCSFSTIKAQNSNPVLKDSITVQILPKYDSVSHIHRYLFGENYRKEYAAPTKVPIIRISELFGGLRATQLGGGNQSRSLRLVDATGKEYVLRSVEKYPEVLLPEALKKTFAGEIIKDNMSAQHPFSALIVPTLASAAGLYHTDPIIGWVAPDPGLGNFDKGIVNTVCLLEERYPSGKSDNTLKMLKKLSQDYNMHVDAEMMLKQKCLDVLIGDWDRHDDQWRWTSEQKDGIAIFQPVPRDRDQVFYRSDGFIQRQAQSTWLLPMMQGYERDIKNINWFLWEGREMQSRIFDELDKPAWDRTVLEFCKTMKDDILEKALRKLPEPGYSLRHDQLLSQLKSRRESLPEMMAEYYRFFNRVVDIPMTDKNESIKISPADDKQLQVLITKANKLKKNSFIYSRVFDPRVTKEIRLYVMGGMDSINIDNESSPIKVKIIGGEGIKTYDIINGRKVTLYEKRDISITRRNGVKLHLSDDTLNTQYIPKDMYSRHLIFPNIGYNNDDGLALGLGINMTSPGFRKTPYGNSQTVDFLYSFGTSALQFNYAGVWTKAIGKADFLLNATVKAPSNTQNFFGLGNQTPYDDQARLSYYRARFNLYKLDPALRWKTKKSSFTFGPSLEYYTYDSSDNSGRLISVPGMLHSSDSTTVDREKLFIGAVAEYSIDTRNSTLLPSKGLKFNLKVSGYTGLNDYSNDYGQLSASLSVYQGLGKNRGFVIADRIGGGITVGKPAFYQAQFIGGQGNLLGFRQFRFAGEQAIYNNLEVRARLANLASYVFPGQLGLIGLYDTGRVWKRSEQSVSWHHGFGGGIYFAPAGFLVIRTVAAYSVEGWYPYVALSFRY